ncbi:MAG: right-handed parallel beta-helix repeat-containing protein [Bacteroidales bacterium]|nr:right-handed parallel beta-helix repeat-containing protein [Bacteroidales bacterium]
MDLLLDGDNTALISGYSSTNGADIDAAEGVTVYETGINNLIVQNNIFKNLSYFGVTLYDYAAGVPSSGHVVADNKFQDFGTYDSGSGVDFWGGGVLLYNNQYTRIANNVMTNVRLGVQTGNFYQANPGSSSSQVIDNNAIEARRTGVFHNLHYTAASTFTFSNNTITALNNANETRWDGIALSSLSVPSVSYNNTINGNSITRTNLTKGYEIWNVQTPVSESTISGGSVSGVDIGVFANNYEGYSSDGGDGAHATLSNLTISPKAGGTGIRLLDSPSSAIHANVQLAIGAGVVVNGGDYGLVVENASAKAISPLGNLALNGQTAKYIRLIGNANDIDATAVIFDSKSGSAMTLTELFATEDKIDHKIDLATLGFVTVKAENAFVTDIAAPTSTNNDYTRILNAVELVSNNWSINLHGTFDWTESNASASWALGNDGLVSPADNYAIYVPANLNGITFTAPEGLSSATINGPGDLPTANLEGVLAFEGGDNQNWTISNIEFSEFDMPIAMFNGAGGTDAFNGTTITNNKFNIAKDLNKTIAPADPNQNIGLHFSHGANQTISNNIFNVPADGISDGTNYSTIVVMQSNTSGGAVYDGLKIKDNTINVTGIPNPTEPAVIRGIWENGANSNAAIEISGNVFTNTNAGNTADLNRQVAFWITSVSSASKKVEYKNNEVSGFSEGVAWIGGLYTSYTPPSYLTGQFPVEIKNNKFDGTKNAVVVRKAVTSTNPGSPALINNNSFTNLVSGGLAIKNEGTGDALSTCNWFGTSDGDLIPAYLSGGVTFSPWLNSGGDGAGTGFQPTGSCDGSPVVIASATPDHIICSEPSGSIEVVFSGGVADYTISWTGGTPVSGISGSPYTISGLTAGAYTIVVTDNLGTSATINATVLYQPVYNASLGTYHTSIQSAITAAAANNVLSVCAGSYAEDIIVNKPLDIRGPNHLINPNTGTRIAEAIIHPATSSPFGEIIKVQASNVKISGLTIDGDNPLLPPSALLGTNGATLDAAEAVTVYVDNVNNLTISNNIIQNLTYFGVTIFGASYSSPTTSEHLISGNLIKDLGTYTDPEPNPNSNMNYWGGGILLYNDQYARIVDNVMTNVRTGIQTGNFHDPNTGSVDFQVINNNSIQARRNGIFYNLHTGNPASWTISNNTVTALANSNETKWGGIAFSSLSEAVGTASGNTINAGGVTVPSVGYEIWNVKSNAPATIIGGGVSGVDIGVFANNYEGYSSNGTNGAYGIVNGLTITTKTGGTGVKAYDSPSYTGTNPALVSIEVKNNCSISGAANGILAEGADASVIVTNNLATITGNEVGIRVKDGADLASVTGNTITNNTHGGIVIESTAGTIGVINNNTISGNGYTFDATHGLGLKNELSTTVDAQNNWWGDASGPYNMPYNTCGTGNAVVGPADFMPWLDGVGGSPVTLPVYNQDKDTYYCKIQDAIDDADADDVILVSAGTYAESLVINTPVDLRGPNYNINPNTGSRGAEAIITFPTGLSGSQELIAIGQYDSRVDVDNVKINGFIIDGSTVATTANTTGIMCNVDNLVVKNNIIRNFNYVSVWVSSYVYEGSTWKYDDYNNNSVIQDNYIHNAGIYAGLITSDVPYGVYLQGTYGTVTGNEVETVRTGIQVQPYNHPNTTTLTGLVSGNSFEAYRDAMWYNYSDNANADWVFDGNTGTGIVAPPAITESSWHGFRTTTNRNGELTVANNVLSPGATAAPDTYGVLFVQPSAASVVVSIENNTISGFDYGVNIPAGLAYAGNIDIQNNKITGNTSYGVFNGATTPVNATLNWWGFKRRTFQCSQSMRNR